MTSLEAEFHKRIKTMPKRMQGHIMGAFRDALDAWEEEEKPKDEDAVSANMDERNRGYNEGWSRCAWTLRGRPRESKS